MKQEAARLLHDHTPQDPRQMRVDPGDRKYLVLFRGGAEFGNAVPCLVTLRPMQHFTCGACLALYSLMNVLLLVRCTSRLRVRSMALRVLPEPVEGTPALPGRWGSRMFRGICSEISCNVK